MNRIIFIYFLFIGSIATSQNSSNFHLDFESYGLGSSLGRITKIYYVKNNILHASFYSRYSIDEVDTNYTTDYILHDTIWRKDTLVIKLRQTSIDSISQLITNNNDTIFETNPCTRSGALYTLIVRCDEQHKVFKLYNSFDSTAYEITNIIQTYLPKNAVDPRPIDSWVNARKCWEAIKTRQNNREEDKVKQE